MTPTNNDKPSGVRWLDVEVRLSILQVLLDARKRNTGTGGVPAQAVADTIMLDDLEQFEAAIRFLWEVGHIQVSDGVLSVTASGVDSLAEHLAPVQSNFAPLPDDLFVSVKGSLRMAKGRGDSWKIPELKVAILTILLDAHVKRRNGCSRRMIGDILDIKDTQIEDLEFCIWYPSQSKKYLAKDERLYTITEAGIGFLKKQLPTKFH